MQASLIPKQQRAAAQVQPGPRVTPKPHRCVRVSARKEAAALATTLSAALVAQVPSVQAAAEVATNADAASLPFAIGGGAAIAGLGALLVATDPQKR